MEEKKIIVFSDGRSLECELNGNCYITEQAVSTVDLLSEDNLIRVTINGEEYRNMHCDNVWTPPDGSGDTWFVIREKTVDELKEEEILAKIDFLLMMQGVE